MDTNALLRQLPKVDVLLEREDIAALAETMPRVLVVDAVRDAIDATRSALLGGQEADAGADAVAARAVAIAAQKARRSLRRVINATGIVVHTNLGRSPLAAEAVAAVDEVAAGYSTLEFDVESGERGSRHVHVEQLLCKLTGAEAAMAVNNNAAAVMLAIAGLARGKEAIVSRGQLVEIGGSFRVPDVMAESGATMVEVGTTNKTHLRDYENALSDRTGLLLKVHTSNYRVVGFTDEVELSELVQLGQQHGIPVMEDQGSGVLVDLREWGLPEEPTVSQSVAAGADVITCSGDKLLGGPQAGILVGRYHVISALKRHPLARAVRLDKMTLAALETTLRLYLDPAKARTQIPTLRMLSMTHAEAAERATGLRDAIAAACGDAFAVSVRDDVSRAGGGALPMADIPTVVVAIAPSATSVDELECKLRLGEPHIIARINEGELLLDPRTLGAGEDAEIVAALAAIAGR
ncbi:MAG TPA: L-seryl-tRNA(Sec) selenium transferase [Coriobacteriia bacterium]|nr:L-seryl-tRNA(Sec) selenium transferase [Coriobacteriia bacterium]